MESDCFCGLQCHYVQSPRSVYRCILFLSIYKALSAGLFSDLHVKSLFNFICTLLNLILFLWL